MPTVDSAFLDWMSEECAPPTPMLCPREEEDWVGRGGGTSKLASKSGGSSTYSSGLPDDCARLLPSQDVSAAGLNRGLDEIARLASKSGTS